MTQDPQSSPDVGAVEREQKAIARSLRLRGSPPPVTRVSRTALVVAGGLLSAGLAGAIGWSLAERPKTPPPETAQDSTPPAQGLADLPRDYLHRTEVPLLGPPLPGDLGRPILRAQARSEGVIDPQRPEPASTSALPATRPERLVSRREAVKASDLFLAVTAPPASQQPAAQPAAAEADPRTTSPERLQAPASPYVLQAGAIIPAALVTGLRSDAAGLAIAQVTQDVFDSLGGHHLLIPAGARLIGDYATATNDGQSRLGVAWTRLILPSGRSIVLDKLPAADPRGMAGLQDGVDRHWGRVWSAAALSTVLSVGAEAGGSDEGDLSRAVRRGVSQAAGDAGQLAVGRSLSQAPTLTIRPGAPLRVLLTRDLVLEPYEGQVG